ncbi:MAG: hypothetical protein ACYSSP_03655 [Planctomycetota bacterium]|jgi:hypothetical protein
MFFLTLIFILTGCSSVDHYRTHQDCESLWNILYTLVKPVDSREQIETLLGAGMLQTGERKKRLISANKRLMQKYPEDYPYGIKDTDEFVGYFCYGATLYLQFRDGRLINFNRDDYKRYQP